MSDYHSAQGPMRILWLSPGLRTLSRMYAEGLQTLGADVLLVTSAIHPESGEPLPYERVLLGRPVPTAGWKEIHETYRLAKQFKPDVIVTEFLRDPRWRAFSDLAPRVRLLHDAAPHDSTHVAPWWNRLFFNRWDEKANATIVFSQYVARQLLENAQHKNVHVAPLTSDLPPQSVPPFVPVVDRRNLVLVGRQRPYKNHAIVFAAWEAHTKGTSWPGDELILIGDGEVAQALPKHVRWIRKQFRYELVINDIAHARGSIVHSRSASQSGVHVMSQQVGVPTIISTAGGLSEYQPPGLSPIGVDDVEGLKVAMDELANPARLELLSQLALNNFYLNYEPQAAARKLISILESVRREGISR